MDAPHTHEEVEVYLILRGRATLFVGDEKKILRPRTIVWLFPDQEHRLAEYTSDLLAWVIAITPDLATTLARRLPIMAERDPGKLLMRTLPSRCVRLLDEIAQSLATGFQPLDCHGFGFAWWLASAWNAYQYGDSRDAHALHAAIPRTIALLRMAPGQDLTTLAHATGISPSQLSRLFKRQVGMSITDFRNRLRLDTFMERWEAEPDGIMFELAKESGFGSYAQFSRVFRRHMECCPEAYYRTHRHELSSRSLPESLAALSSPILL